jgi:RHS repeat-associated protein
VKFNLRFPGQYYDEVTKQHYNHNRFYNPVLGRYVEPDPIGLEGGLNPYIYAGANPINGVDPTGLDPDYLAMTDPAAYYELRAIEFGYDPYTREGANATAKAVQKEAFFDLLGWGIGRGAGGMLSKIEGKFFSNSVKVWKLPATSRGNQIEATLARTEYKDWFNVGQLNNGKFPLVDFQKGNNLVSLKSIDTTGTTWMRRMQEHIDDLGRGRATVNNVKANMILDLRVQPGGLNEAKSLIGYGQKQGITVIVKEFK